MKKVTYVTLWGTYLFSKVHICDAKIAYLDDIANLETLPYGLHFQKSCNVLKSGVTIFVFKCHNLWPSNSLFRKYNQFGNLTLSYALF